MRMVPVRVLDDIDGFNGDQTLGQHAVDDWQELFDVGAAVNNLHNDRQIDRKVQQ